MRSMQSKVGATAYCYSIVHDEWTVLKEMKQARQKHGSCVLGNSLFVVCGIGSQDQPLNSIEKLIVTDQKKDSCWVTI